MSKVLRRMRNLRSHKPVRKNGQVYPGGPGLAQHLLDNSVDVIFRYRYKPTEHYEYISPSIYKFLGVTAEEVYQNNQTIFQATLPEDRRFIDGLIDDQAEYSYSTISLRHRNGRILRAEMHFRRIFDEHGELTALEGVARDITSRVTAEKGLALLIENNPLPILLTTIHEGRILEANESALRLFEYTREEILGKTTPELNIWPDLESRKNSLQEILKEPLGSNHEIQYYTKSRRPITCLITAVQIEYNGEPCILTMSMDITERKTREELLRENEDRFRYIIQHDYNGIAVLDYQERILFVSERFLEDFHLKDRSIIGKPFRESFPEISPRWRDLVRRVLAGAVERCDEDFLRTPEGGVEYFRWECRPYYTKPDVIGGMVLYSEIITQRKERENQLEAIASITEALRNAVSQKEIYPILLDQVQSILHTDAVAVILRDQGDLPNAQADQDSQFSIRLARGDWEPFSGAKAQPGKEIRDVFRADGEIFINNQLREDPGGFPPAMIGGLSAVAAVPLSAESSQIGALWIGRQTQINLNERRTLASLANIAASALQRASLHDQTSLHLRRLTTLRAIDQAISASLDLRVALSILINQITLQLHIDAANVLLYNPITQMLSYAAGRNLESPDFKNIHLRLGESSAGQVALTRRVEYVTDVHNVEPVFTKKLINAGFTTYIALPLLAKGRIKGVLELFHRSRIDPSPEWLDFLNAVAAQAAIAIDNAELFEQLQTVNTQLSLAYDATIEGWSRALELRGIESSGHTQRVTELCVRLARRLQMAEADVIHLQRGALLHDIGLLGVPDAILLKTGALDEAEQALLRQHPLHAYALLHPIQQLRQALAIPSYHHERWDGGGYPDHLSGEAIPLPARIFAVANAWEELTRGFSGGGQQPLYSPEQALEYLRQETSREFDPQVVAVFLSMAQEPGFL